VSQDWPPGYSIPLPLHELIPLLQFGVPVMHTITIHVQIGSTINRRLLEGLPQTESKNAMMNNILLAMNDTLHLWSIVEGVLAQLQAYNHLQSAYQYISCQWVSCCPQQNIYCLLWKQLCYASFR
jgi:hypothetical protein